MEDNSIMVSTQKNILACMAAVCRRAWNNGLIDPVKVGMCTHSDMKTARFA